jgi:AcrR family transcriptional regulator
MQVSTPGEGLRERKKRQTRTAIAEAAIALFGAHGFDAVTVADVARAADVSEKTVFNYVPTKEDLVLGRGAERTAALIEALRTRSPGTSVVDPFRDATMDLIDRVEREPIESIVALPRLVTGSEQLRNRLFLDWEREAATLAPVVAAEAGKPEDDLVAAVVARTLAWTHRLVFRAAFTRLIAGESRRRVAADLREQAARAYDQLERGLGDYAPKPSTR